MSRLRMYLGQAIGFSATATAAVAMLIGPSVGNAGVVNSVPLAAVPRAAHKLTAYGGYVVFSQLDATGKWRLKIWHAGSITTLPVGQRQLPFDAEAGPGPDGRPAVVYSKCEKDPSLSRSPESEEKAPDWAKATGCRIYELSLAHGRPGLVKGIYSPNASDSTPAIWRGDIAFARRRSGSSFTNIYIWHHLDRHLFRLGGGPSSCPAGTGPSFGVEFCNKPVSGLSTWVNGISLGPNAVAFEWILSIPETRFGFLAEPEIRVDPLMAGRQSASGQVVSFVLVKGTCGGGEGLSPSVVGNTVLYAVTFGDCQRGPEELFSRFASYSSETRRERIAAPLQRGLVAAVAQDGNSTYWIKDTLLEDSEPHACRPGNSACGGSVFSKDGDCDPAHGNCTLMRTDGLKRAVVRP
jgi:hypothetical protein